MALNRRCEEILERIEEHGEVLVADLAERFNVTPMTIRRDLDRLEHLGRVKRTHGGAVLSQAGVVEFAFLDRERARQREKRAIAQAAVDRIEPGMTITLDTGTTTLEVARALAGIDRLKVLTSSLPIASALYAHDNVDLVLLGGNVRKGNPDLHGPLTESNLREFRVELAVIGADAAGPEGLFTTDLGISRVSKAMIAGARRAIAVVDSSKFERTSFVRFAEWGDVAELISDEGLSAGLRRDIEKAGVEVTCVGAGA